MTQPNETQVPEVNAEENQNGEKLTYEEMEAELKRVRNEAASRRVQNREIKTQAQTELEEAARKWKEYEESQKTELQKLQDQLAERDRMLSEYSVNKLRGDVAKEFGLDSEDAELLTGSDEATIRKQAERLKTRLGTKNEAPRPVDLLAGTRGQPIGSQNDNANIDDIIRAMARQ